MRKTITEVLEPGEMILGSPTVGKYMVRSYLNGEEVVGGFLKTKKEARVHAREYRNGKVD